ncbi:hypothetical protein Lesp02_72800 [Lentzea sp. NBRC 105346]|uniref:hypothetical protein n=1 Tax=Lentzea sp. NBRC 105346 TaxID=3032205 RepID=UPI0024A05D8A|nr:hypothetical protein [Lentzea sp. NBRC 105346]GLZ35093.1 hypothetical protein Lesp02_72800 [Lentzea sp. NBRC 105346]
MSTNRIGRRTAERLLRGLPRTGPDRLDDLLAAAAAPARESELSGEGAAMAAFRSAQLAPATHPRRRSMIKIGLAKLLTAKAAAVAVVAAGGIAVAAAAGGLPGPDNDAPKPQHGNQVVEHTGNGEKPATKEKGNGDNPSPSPSLKGQCQAYTAGAGEDHGKKRDNPSFAALAAAAGGEDKVDTFCADLLADKPGKTDPGKSDEHQKDKPNR